MAGLLNAGGLEMVGDSDTEDYLDERAAANGIDVSRPPSGKKDKQPPRPPPADKPIDAKVTQLELEKSLCSVYNLINRLLHIDKRYRPGDFAEESDGLMSLINQFSRLRIVGRFLGPVAAMGAMWDKVDDTLSELRARRRPKAPPPPTSLDLSKEPVANGASKAPFK